MHEELLLALGQVAAAVQAAAAALQKPKAGPADYLKARLSLQSLVGPPHVSPGIVPLGYEDPVLVAVGPLAVPAQNPHPQAVAVALLKWHVHGKLDMDAAAQGFRV